jgi:glycosyltransferase involved in cell wall biosynthesis
VLHGETGLLADVGDSNQLGENIAFLLGNVRFREKILSQSIPNIHKLFSYKENALAYKKLYSEMCSKSL